MHVRYAILCSIIEFFHIIIEIYLTVKKKAY
jgi:hypothetical protein